MIGQTIAQYHIVRRIGEGGMGVVYEAEDTNLGRRVAIKFLPEAMSRDSGLLERFRREARAASALNHPHICTIHDLGEHEGQPYIAMELLQGQTLKHRIGGKAMPLEEVLRQGAEIADALEAAHGQGIIHRDIKPANLFITDRGQAKVLDFGLAKITAEASGGGDSTSMPTKTLEAELTQPGSTMGTVSYMSPEQARAEEVDARSDLFSLGVVLYEMTTGKLPFTGKSQAQIFKQLLADSPSPPSRLNPEVPPELSRIIMEALEKDRDLRIQSAVEIKAGLKRLMRDTDSGQVSEASQFAFAPARKSTSTKLLVGVAVATTLILGIVWFARRPQEARDSTQPAHGGQGAIVQNGSESRQTQPTVAVLPFNNLGSDDAVDYLSLAIPSEVSTTLSRGQGLAVRPFTRSVSYRGPAVDLRQAADELRAEHLVTGQFFATGDEIQVTLEAIKIEDDSLLWSESLSIPKNNLSELGRQVAELIRIQLLPLLSSGGPVSEGTLPNDSEAYEIYLKSLSLGTDPEPNQQGIELLERAVERDPGYAPAWAELSSRLHRRGAYAGGGAVDYNASDVAAVRALRLDPELVSAGTQLAMLRTERGDLLGAYDLAEDVVTRRPDSSAAHFAKSYVLRYAGLLNDSAAECEAALKLDPTDSGLRSCGLLYRRLGNFTRSKYFYALDAGSLWQKLVLAIDYIVEGDPTKALADYRQLDHSYFFWRTVGRVLEAFLEEPTELEAATRSAMELFATIVDGETLFHSAGTFAYCGQSQAALDLLNRAVELSYCAVDLDTYSPFSSLRDDKEFQRIHQAAVDCQQRFLEHRARRRQERGNS